MSARTWQPADVLALGVRTDLDTANSIFGIGRTTGYALARQGEYPVPTLRVGRKYVVRVADVLAYLRISPTTGNYVGVPGADATAVAS